MENKPISIILDDLKNGIADLINNSQLPPSLVEPIMKDLYNEVSMVAKQQLEQDKKNWEASQSEPSQEVEKVEGEVEE